jgi:hypothetical protein
MVDLMEPAMDRPPSPERIRALNRQLENRQLENSKHLDPKQSSSGDKHRSHQTTSSGASSLRSATSDRPSWDQSAENLSISRKSSQRSTTSSMPSRERPESVQIFGKTLFNRRGKSKRESSDHSSSSGSLYSTDAPIEPAVVTGASKDTSFMSSVFARRKTMRADSDPLRRLQISGPYNFQHLTQIQDEVNGRATPDYPALRSLPTTTEELRLRQMEAEMALEELSSESLPILQQDPSAGLSFSSHGRIHGRGHGQSHSRGHSRGQSRGKEQQDGWQSKAPPPPRIPPRSLHRTQSQEQMRSPPPRPPRSPTEHVFRAPIAPPPRGSSRGSVRYDMIDAVTTRDSPERPNTATGLRYPHPKPLVLSPPPPRPGSAAGSSGQTAAAAADEEEDEQALAAGNHRYSHAISTPDEAAWPLTASTMTSLPEVPEEEELHPQSPPFRISTISNSSSLRGSVSVPLLRQLSQSQSAAQRPMSNASDTLGRFDLASTQRDLRGAAEDFSQVDEDLRDNWEDDIDYCYDHAAEADFDYAWERPSCDMDRAGDDDQDDDVHTLNNGQPGLGKLSAPSKPGTPALSPAASSASNTTHPEAITPTVSLAPVTSNFSLPRRDSSALQANAHNRNFSHSSSFKESQGFHLSPTLLIPTDYHQQMLLHERDELRDKDDTKDVRAHGMASGEPISRYDHFAKSHARSSASTTDSMYSGLSSNRHKSTSTTSTANTRWTGSSTTGSVGGWQAHGEAGHHDEDKPVGASAMSRFEKGMMSPLPEQDGGSERPSRENSSERHTRTQSHAATTTTVSNGPASPGSPGTTGGSSQKTPKQPVHVRRRAKTTSRSHNVAGAQFGLFPSLH